MACDWRLWGLRIMKFALLLLSVVAIVIKISTDVPNFREFMVFFYLCIFEVILVLAFSSFTINKLSLGTRYFQFAHYNIGYGALGLFFGLLALITKKYKLVVDGKEEDRETLKDVRNLVPLSIGVFSCLIITMGCCYHNHTVADVPEVKESASGGKTISPPKQDKEKLKTQKSNSSPPATTVNPGNNKVPPPLF